VTRLRKPLVGINTKLVRDGRDLYHKLDANYVRSVERAGGVPVVMPAFRTRAQARDYLGRLDALVFTGGPDLDPRRWRERKHPKADLMVPERETSDFLALREALRRDLPLLAICCGCQELNVALGGSLHQHVGDLPGVGKHADGVRHPVRTFGSSRLSEVLGLERPSVNSWHHQSCARIGRDLVVTAGSPDGLVEAVESTARRWVVGVQWHPERMQDDRRQRALFAALVDEARR
jgi:putative glutamine amidotransferase